MQYSVVLPKIILLLILTQKIIVRNILCTKYSQFMAYRQKLLWYVLIKKGCPQFSNFLLVVGTAHNVIIKSLKRVSPRPRF